MQESLCRLYTTVSVDGYIATRPGCVDWLPPYGSNTGITDFLDQIGVVVMGRHSFEQLMELDSWPLAGKRVVVMSSRSIAQVAGHVIETWDGSPSSLLANLRMKSDGDIWLLGGATVVREWLELTLIDRLELHVIPLLLGNGKRLFPSSPRQQALELDAATTWPGGVICLRYSLPKEERPLSNHRP